MGHTGTLDPMATGVLAVCVGEATKLVPYMRLEPYGMIIVIVLLVSGILGKVLWPLVEHFVGIVGYLFNL
jgi:hypothetical protein